MLIPFVCAGSPSLDDTVGAIGEIDRAGARVIEVGVPFSDPIADGPTIAAAMHSALDAGVTPAKVFDAVRAVRGGIDAALVAMLSVSIVHRLGPARFARDAAGAGFDGVILPDVTVDELGAVAGPLRDAGLTVTLLVAPTTPETRAARIASACSGFVYLLARVGITGAQADPGAGAPVDLAQRVRTLRSRTTTPIACGFGIATAADVRAVVRDGGADAAIVGTAYVRRMEDAARGGASAAGAAGELTRELSAGLV